LLLLSSQSALSQSAKVAYADIDSIAVSLPEFKQKQQELQTYGKKLSDQLASMQQEFEQKYQNYQQNGAEWLPEVVQVKQKELQQLEQDLMAFQQNSQRNLQRKEQELLDPLYTRITAAIEKVANAQGYSHVLPANMLLYKQTQYDITQNVITSLTK
jgi:outer membrane protein